MSWNDEDDHRSYYRNHDYLDSMQIMYISLGIGAMICLAVFCCCLFKKRRREGIVRSTVPNPASAVIVYPQTGTAPQPCHNIQQHTDASGTFYAVPFSALPANFDYSSPNIVVKSDHVILRDLSQLQTLQTANTTIPPNDVLPPPYSSTQAYTKQSPYNPEYPN